MHSYKKTYSFAVLIRFWQYFSLFAIFSFFARNIYAQQDSTVVVGRINIYGNEKTKSEIILRETDISEGDTISIDEFRHKLKSFKENLCRTMLFNYINIEYSDSAEIVDVDVKVDERWYYWVYPILEIADRNATSYFYYRDFKKINYGAAFDWLNFRGRNEMLNFKIRLGYKEHYAVSYQKKNIGPKYRGGLWVNAEFFRQKEITTAVVDNKPVYSENEKYIKNVFSVGAGYIFRPQINYDLNIGLTYARNSYNDSAYLGVPSYVQHLLMPRVKFDYDNRNNKVYPTSGLDFNVEIKMYGDVKNFEKSFATANVGFEYNVPVFRDIIFYRANANYRHIIGDPSKILEDRKIELCKDFGIRGYDYYYILGSHFESLSNTFSFKLWNSRIYQFPDWVMRKFRKIYVRIYSDFFVDVAYSGKFANLTYNENTLYGKFFYSTGVGVNIETYYDRLLKVYVAYNGYFNNVGVFIDYKTPIYKLF